MFVLYPFVIAALYTISNKIGGPKNIWKHIQGVSKHGGPLNPIDDIPARIMPHVMSCISDSALDNLPMPDPSSNPSNLLKNVVNTKQDDGTQNDLPFRRIPKKFQGFDMRNVTTTNTDQDIDLKLKLLKNMKTLELIHDLNGPRLSVLKKLEAINLHDRTHGSPHESYKKHMLSGGLMDDWEFSMD
jgi:hypothetical protein